MGTSDFIIHKDDYKLSNKLWKMRNNIVCVLYFKEIGVQCSKHQEWLS